MLADTGFVSILPPSEVVINLCDSGDEECTAPNKSCVPLFSFNPLALDDGVVAQ
jgi:hypothetical protein